jgi:hydrogenase maturation protease
VNPVSASDQPTRQPRTLVLGLGNTVLSDDGVGIYVTREIEKRISMPSMTFEEASLGGLDLLERFRGFDRVILIDAVQTGRAEVGEVIKLSMDDLKGGSSMTRHQVPLHEALLLGQKLNMELPEEIEIYGIEVQEILTFSESCTPVVASKIPQIVEAIIDEARLEKQDLSTDS